MGRGDTAAKIWFRNKDRFADLFNGTIFDGEQMIRPEDLEIVDGEADILITDQNNRTKKVQRYRDVVMRWKNNINFVILACENQEKIHYAMPVRTMLYDSLSYVEQMKKIWKETDRKSITQEEFLSRFRKEDCLYPVITIVFYYGEKEWDGSRNLHEMFSKNIPTAFWEKVKFYIPNYHINLVDPNRMDDFEKFQTDLQLILGMLQCKNEKEKLMEYVLKHKEYFKKIDVETYNVIKEFLNSEKILKNVVCNETEGGVDMCKALEELYEDGVEQGIEQGLQALIDTCKEFGCSRETTLQKLVEKISVSEKQAEIYMEKYWK